MMCWENLEGFLVEEPNEETGSQDGTADNDMEKPKYKEEHADHTQHTGNHVGSSQVPFLMYTLELSLLLSFFLKLSFSQL